MNLEQIRKLASEVYDSVYVEREDVPFYRQIAARYAEGRILECGCGTGRVTIPLAEAGYSVDGLDISLPRLQVLRSRLQTLPGRVSDRITCCEGDMKDFSLEENYALILTPFRTFQHLLTPADQRKSLKNLWRHLKPGGRLLIDIFNPSIPRLADPIYLKPFGDDRFHPMPDGRLARFKQRIVAREYAAQTQ
jgi:SAM-dependent methyltransferase